MNPDLELLLSPGADQRFERWRGRRPGAAAPVLLKRARRTPPAPGDREALQRECAVAAGLSSAATLLPRLVESDAAATLVMEDPGGELLSKESSNNNLNTSYCGRTMHRWIKRHLSKPSSRSCRIG